MFNLKNIELLEKINSLTESADKGKSEFPSELCDFIVTEYELNASVLFSLGDNNNMIVLGKSRNAKTIFARGTSFKCFDCKNYESVGSIKTQTDKDCDIRIFENNTFDFCIKIVINRVLYVFKLAKTSPFTTSDEAWINIIKTYFKSMLTTWTLKQNIYQQLKNNVTDIVVKTSQELRTPANTIIGFTSILSEDNLTSSQAEYISTIKKNAQNILLVINDLFDIAKIESGKMEFNKNKFALIPFVQQIIDVFKNKTSEIKYSVSLETAPGIPEKIVTDDQKLRFILNNIILFGLGSNPSNEIKIKINQADVNIIRFEINITGKKLSPEIVSSIFEPFALSKLDDSKELNITGLSFALSKKYISLFGGNITAEKEGAEGLKFVFSVINNENVDIESIASKIPMPSASKNRVLVIEDDYATSKLISNYLSKWEYDPILTNNEQQVFNYLDREEFLAVIMDIAIPNINGLELLKKINLHPNSKNTPVIICSIEAEQQKAMLLGAVEYFVKPINYRHLGEVLTSYKMRKDSKVLCVDDDIPTLNLLKQAVETAGYNAVAEHISANVMDILNSTEIDLAIVDLDMPHPNGFELIKMIKSEPKFNNLPIIIYTGKENFDEELKEIEGLFENLFPKRSTNLEDIAQTIKSMINRYETPSSVEEVSEKKDEIKILFAEDYKHSQIIVTRLLKKNSFENVVVVENGEEALNMAKKEQFNLILMDMQMPIMNGFEATERIKKLSNYKNIPIIALTAFAMKGDREKCLEAGATDYIPKPIDSKEFIEKVKYYTSMRK